MTDEQPHNLPRAIGKPATRALIGAGYTELEQLTNVTEKEIAQLHGVGPKAMRILKATLEADGLSFASPNDK